MEEEEERAYFDVVVPVCLHDCCVGVCGRKKKMMVVVVGVALRSESEHVIFLSVDILFLRIIKHPIILKNVYTISTNS
jgi:hypothetical protein